IPKLKASGAKVDSHLDVCAFGRSDIFRLASRALLLSSREQLGEGFVDQFSQQGRLGWLEVSGVGFGHKRRWKIVTWVEIQSLPNDRRRVRTRDRARPGRQKPSTKNSGILNLRATYDP